MAEIQVVIPEKTGDTDKDRPLVFRFDTCVRPGEPVVWRIWALNTDVVQVIIEFANQKHAFFGQTFSAFEDLGYNLYDKAVGNKLMGEGAIVGSAPKLPYREECKYLVRCRGTGGKDLGIDLDPKIIIDGP